MRAFLAEEVGLSLAGERSLLFYWQLGGLPRTNALDDFLAKGDGIRRLFVGENK